jgi:hypothetical protein
VTGVLRLGSLLIILLLTAPMLHDCCLPVTQVRLCHDSKHDDAVTCSARLQAVAENKGAAVTPSVSNQFYIAADGNPTVPTEERCLIHRAAFAPLPANEIYLRTGALLI